MGIEYDGERFMPIDCDNEMKIEHFQRYQFARKFVENKVVLDAACGEGYGSNLLSEVAKKVVGVDLDGQVIETARGKYVCDNLEYVQSSVEKLPFEDNSFDVVISFETIEHVDGAVQEKFLQEIARILKPDGILIMSTPNKAVYTDLVDGENVFHIKEFYANEYLEFLKQRFEYVEFLCQYPEVGYYISRENERVCTSNRGVSREECRYVIAVCSNTKNSLNINFEDMACFDDSMYYFLNARVHKLEKQIINMKKEADAFQQQLENSITEQKEYIKTLEERLNQTNF